MPFERSRLYAILDVEAVRSLGHDPLHVVDVWLEAGIRLVQLRAKTLPGRALLSLTDALLDRTRPAKATLIINDRADIAAMAGADGVHVGQDDLSPRAVRRLVGQTACVGLSTHGLAQIDAGCLEPVTYLAIGPVFATASKANTNPTVGIEGVRDAAARARAHGLPVVAIGGITMARAPEVLAAGAASVAVIGDLLAGDLRARARAFVAAVQPEAAAPTL